MLIDSGCGDALQRLGSVDAVVYTHHHPDHISGHHLLPRSVRVVSPCGEEAYTELEHLARRYAGYRYRAWLRFATTVIGVREVPRPTTCFEPGEDFCVGSACFKTYPAPGHMLTHTLIELPGGWLHLADIDLTGFGPWYGNPESDPSLFLSDIVAAASLEARSYTTGHTDRVLVRDQALAELRRYALKLFEHAERLLRAVAGLGPATPRQLTGRGVIYPRYVPGAEELMQFFEETMVRKLLSLLHALGCVKRGRSGFEASEAECTGLERLKERVLSAIG